MIPIKRSLALESQEKSNDISDDTDGKITQLNHKVDQLTELVKHLQKQL